MFDWLQNLLGTRKPVTSTATYGIRARYENALANDENARHWAQVDYLSAKSANSFQIRRTLRLRTRQEASNNPYLFGISTSNADDLINTGPTLKCKWPSESRNRRFERGFNDWAAEIELVEKLRTCKLAKSIDGEGFLVFKTNEAMEHPVKMYPIDVEADQVTAPMAKDLQETWLDGIAVNKVTGRPISYTVLKNHPGDYLFPGLNPLASDTIRARFVIHWFAKFRPGQIRGVPAFTTSLDLFSELRAFRRAVLQKANIAANLTAVIQTEGPAAVDADGNPTQAKPFVSIPIDRGTATFLPGGAEMRQYQTGDPSTTYEMFSEKCLGEACRPLSYPLNLALGTSQRFNFSSARLDHVNYRNSLNVERAECDRVVLDHMLAAYVEEGTLVRGLLPSGVDSIADVPHEWHWPGYAPLDPVADADADHARIANGTLTWQQFWASRGYDWREVLEQQAKEQDEIRNLKVIFGDPARKTDGAKTPEFANAA